MLQLVIDIACVEIELFAELGGLFAKRDFLLEETTLVGCERSELLFERQHDAPAYHAVTAVEECGFYSKFAATSARRERSPLVRVTWPAISWCMNRFTTWTRPLLVASTYGLSIW